MQRGGDYNTSTPLSYKTTPCFRIFQGFLEPWFQRERHTVQLFIQIIYPALLFCFVVAL